MSGEGWPAPARKRGRETALAKLGLADRHRFPHTRASFITALAYLAPDQVCRISPGTGASRSPNATSAPPTQANARRVEGPGAERIKVLNKAR